LRRLPGVSIAPIADSIAQKAGVLPGDVIVSIDGQAVVRPDDVLRIL